MSGVIIMLTVKELLTLDLGEIKRLDYDTGEVKEKMGVSQKVGQRVEQNFANEAISDKLVFYAEIINTQKKTDYELCQRMIGDGLGKHYKYRAADKNPDDKLYCVTKLKLTEDGYVLKKKFPQLDEAEAVAFDQASPDKFAHVPELFELQYR